MMRSEEESRDEVMKAATSTADDVLGQRERNDDNSFKLVHSNNKADFSEKILQDRDYNALIADDSGILHSDAEEDLKMIQQQLRTFNDVSINERQSVIKNHLEGSANGLN